MATRIRWGRLFGAASAVGVIGFGASWLLAAKPSIENQVWLERLPRSAKDRVLYLLFAAPDDSAERMGGVQVASVWERHLELFRYGLVRDKARLVFPQDGHAVVVTLKAYDCEGQAPEPFTMCLDVTSKGGESVTLYSNEDLSFADLAQVPDLPLDEASVDASTGLLEMLGR